jgi:hypothetical protein
MQEKENKKNVDRLCKKISKHLAKYMRKLKTYRDVDVVLIQLTEEGTQIALAEFNRHGNAEEIRGHEFSDNGHAEA